MSRIPVFYTFGNHQHWVDLQWLWGYHVMPGAIRDMLAFCRETDTKGCVNFDGIGYEKLVAEDPDAFALLKEAIHSGTIEPVGCSYGQPYGLFHGGESNIRQRIYGVRTVLRLFGVRPKTFWEEEFDYFPQLPQLLRRCGFEYASLFFQWTWHTPEVPKEDVPIVWWEAPDGSRLLAATRNKLNLHQWPEDFDGLLDELARTPPEADGRPEPLILQWLELMPSPDWMCRSEVLLPKMKELLEDPRFEVKATTLGAYLGAHATSPATPVRRYSMDQIWHGMSLGKNWDQAPRTSAYLEQELLASESLAATLSLFGRPYANWDVYPTWELEEGWRYLLAFQHHDNHECEGLCGHVAYALAGAGMGLAQTGRSVAHLMRRLGKASGTVIQNSIGWPVSHGSMEPGADQRSVQEVGAFGYKWVPPQPAPTDEARTWAIDGDRASYLGTDLQVEVELSTGALIRLAANGAGVDFGPDDELFPCLIWRSSGEDRVSGDVVQYSLEDPTLLKLQCEPEGKFRIEYKLSHDVPAVQLNIVAEEPGIEPDPGMNSGIQLPFGAPFSLAGLEADTPLLAEPVRPTPKGLRKYPEGDWMTSPQWFEEVENAFTAHSFVDLAGEDGSGILVTHSGSQQWFRDPQRVRCLLHMSDPWDEERRVHVGRASFWLIPHGPLPSSEKRRLAAAKREIYEGYAKPVCEWEVPAGTKRLEPDVPESFCPLRSSPANVIPLAFYREVEDFSGMRLDRYAGSGMGYPFVVRFVEYDGIETSADVILAGPIAKAYKTTLMGEIELELAPEELTPAELGQSPLAAPQAQLDAYGIRPQRLRLRIGPHEIVTLYLDLVPGRKQARDLDAKRSVWATVHRVDG